MSLNVSRDQLIEASRAAGIDEAAAASLWTALEERRSRGAATFTGANVLYYLGGLLVIGAMTFFMSLVWELAGGAFIAGVALLYMLGLGLAGYWLFERDATRRPGGILITAAVCITPLAVYGLEKLTGFWVDGSNPGPYRDFYLWIHQGWLLMEIATVLVGLAALRSIRFPFLTMPIAFALWFLSMDAGDFFLGGDRRATGYLEHWQVISGLFGAAMILGAISIDRRTKDDYAFWGYLYGAAALYAGLSILWNGGQGRLALYAAISLALLALSVVLGRRALTVFAALGLFAYVDQLAWTVFKNSFGFPFALTLIGLGTIAAGIWYQRNEARLRESLVAALPSSIARALPASRA